jgi:hypothetical protein
MTYASDLAAVYAAQGEAVTVAGTAVTAFFDGGYAEALGVAGTGPSLRCIASTVAAAAAGDAVVRAAVTYTVRNILPIPPDELETRLILEAA